MHIDVDVVFSARERAYQLPGDVVFSTVRPGDSRFRPRETIDELMAAQLDITRHDALQLSARGIYADLDLNERGNLGIDYGMSIVGSADIWTVRQREKHFISSVQKRISGLGWPELDIPDNVSSAVLWGSWQDAIGSGLRQPSAHLQAVTAFRAFPSDLTGADKEHAAHVFLVTLAVMHVGRGLFKSTGRLRERVRRGEGLARSTAFSPGSPVGTRVWNAVLDLLDHPEATEPVPTKSIMPALAVAGVLGLLSTGGLAVALHTRRRRTRKRRSGNPYKPR